MWLSYRCLASILLIACAVGFDPSDVVHVPYSGQWTSDYIINSFQVKSGALQMAFGYQAEYSISIAQADVLELLVLNPLYKDGVCARLRIPIGAMDQQSKSWAGNATNVSVEILDQLDLVRRSKDFGKIGSCQMNYNVQITSFQPMTAQDLHYSLQIQPVQGAQEPCLFDLSALDVAYADETMQMLLYGLFACLIEAVQVASCHHMLTSYGERLGQLSLVTLCLSLPQDMYLVVIHFYLMSKQPTNYFYVILPLTACIVSACFSLQLIRKVFRSQTEQEGTSLVVRRKILFLTFLLIVLLISYMMVMYLMPYQLFPLLVQSAVILPQIYANMKHPKKYRLTLGYYIGYLGARALLPLYYRGCPSNIFKLQPSFGFCTLWVSAYAFQFVIVLLQARLGGRFFIPRCCLLLAQEDTYRLIRGHEDPSRPVQQCSICLEQLHPLNICSGELEAVQSPCRHRFHLDCLKRWMEVKAQCPTCRQRLPEIILM